MTLLKFILLGIVVREILAYIFHWEAGWFNIGEWFSDIKHNAAIDRQWEKDGRPVVSTTIGWRRDPWGKEDGYRDNGYGS